MPQADIALVWNAPVRLVDITTRFEPYVEGLRECGLEAVTVCPAATDAGYPYSVKTFKDESEIADPRFWKDLGCRAVAIVTWHRMTNILLAARSAGLRTLSIGESDGLVSPRIHPWATFRFMTFLQPSIRGRLGAAKYWLQRFLFGTPGEHRALVENVAAADVTTFAGQGAVDEFCRFLRRVGKGGLENRIAWLPYPVPESFCTTPLPSSRRNRIIAIGRWDSPQKNAPLLMETIRLLAAGGCEAEVLVVGKGSEKRLARLAREIPTVRVLGFQPRDRLRELMGECRSVLISSRWESGPIVAWEMLALGGTVIGTPIPNLRAITTDARFGCVSRSHRPNALAAAVLAEMKAWDRAERDSEMIASHWRPLVSPKGVAGRMIELLAEQNTASTTIPSKI